MNNKGLGLIEILIIVTIVAALLSVATKHLI